MTDVMSIIEPVGRIGTYLLQDKHDMFEIACDGSEREHGIMRDAFFQTGDVPIPIGHDNKVIRLVDGLSFEGIGRYVSFFLPQMVDAKSLNIDAERMHRESILAMAVERVVFQYIDVAAVRLASVWCESEDGTIPPMLHVFMDDSISDFSVRKILIGMYMYIYNCGYEMDGVGESSPDNKAELAELIAKFEREEAIK